MIKKLFIAVVLTTALFKHSAAQKVDLGYMTHLKPEMVSVYDMPPASATVCIMSMNFADSNFMDKKKITILKGKEIDRIDMVYTDYRLSPAFDQPKLNISRLKMLKKIAPWIFTSTSIDWHAITQTQSKTEAEARNMFHGFVIYYRPTPCDSSFKKEITEMGKIMTSDSLGKFDTTFVTVTRTHRHYVWQGNYLPCSKKKRDDGIVYDNKGIWNRPGNYKLMIDTTRKLVRRVNFIPAPTWDRFLHYNVDSTIFAVMRRNKQWDSIMFVQDVTGSMSPYSMQVLLWNRLNFNLGRSHDYVFFNDGDNKPDNEKVIGKTGGIYYIHADAIRDVENTCYTAMTNGYGGDAPENNLEAVLAAIKESKNCKYIVMIADNNAPVRDMPLLPEVTRPVHIILCGVYNGLINTDYLDIARKTGGSVHTMEEDLNQLMKLREGDSINILGKTYRIIRGKFQLVTSM